MVDKTYFLEIVTPQQIVFSGNVLSFSAPGVEGGFQVLTHHAPLLTMLSMGEVKVVAPDGSTQHYATSGGFVEVRGNKVLLLAETAETSSEIDVARAEAARDRAKGRLSEKDPEVDLERARMALHRAINRLKIAAT
jgi:F-type H+-transporting ATPase subunit epsilon